MRDVNWALIFTAAAAALALAAMVFAGQTLFLDPVPFYIGATPVLSPDFSEAVSGVFTSATDTGINLALAIVVGVAFALVHYGIGPRVRTKLALLFVALTSAIFAVFAAQKAKMGLLIQMQYARVDLERLESILSALYLGLFFEAAFALMAISMIWWDAHHAPTGQPDPDAGGSASPEPAVHGGAAPGATAAGHAVERSGDPARAAEDDPGVGL